ncbi:unnamed protein product [Cuscuta epithymum]|uniref:DUF1985 domain-containing protein n=1 Tax=Cuscuta epithymum TaxID=186058 RepID=A0AAV0C3D4_9ASTE|nr:unnamed protein product [Cuscuta epithymum]
MLLGKSEDETICRIATRTNPAMDESNQELIIAQSGISLLAMAAVEEEDPQIPSVVDGAFANLCGNGKTDSDLTCSPSRTQSSSCLALTHKTNGMFKRMVDKSLVYKDLSNRKLNTFTRLYDSIQLVKSKLDPDQIVLFKNSVFGPFLDAKEMNCCGQLLHFLLGNLVEMENCEDASHMYFEIEDRVVSFSVSDFTLILGFNYHDDVPTGQHIVSERGNIWQKYFPHCKTKVMRRDIKKVFQAIEKGSEHNDDIIKLSLLFVLSHSFLSAEGGVSLNNAYINLVDDLDRFNAYPWGRAIWKDMVSYFKAGVNSMQSNESHYNVYGCVMALQVWAFETFPVLKELDIARMVDPYAFPRILRWSSSARPSSATLKKSLFSNKNFLFRNIEPSSSDLQHENVLQACQLTKLKASISGEAPPRYSETTVSAFATRKKSRARTTTLTIMGNDESTHGGDVPTTASQQSSEGTHVELDAKISSLEKELKKVRNDMRRVEKKVKGQDKLISHLKDIIVTSRCCINSNGSGSQNHFPNHHMHSATGNATNRCHALGENGTTNSGEPLPCPSTGDTNGNSDESFGMAWAQQALNVDYDIFEPKGVQVITDEVVIDDGPAILNDTLKRKAMSTCSQTPCSDANCKKGRNVQSVCLFSRGRFKVFNSKTERTKFSSYIMDGIAKRLRNLSQQPP